MSAMFQDLKELSSMRDLCGRRKSGKSCGMRYHKQCAQLILPLLHLFCQVIHRGHLSSNKLQTKVSPKKQDLDIRGPQRLRLLDSHLTTKTMIVWRINASCSPENSVWRGEKKTTAKTHLEGCVCDTAGLNEITLQRRKQWQEFLQQLKSNPRPALRPNEAWISIYAFDRPNHFKVPISCKCHWISFEVSISGQRTRVENTPTSWVEWWKIKTTGCCLTRREILNRAPVIKNATHTKKVCFCIFYMLYMCQINIYI